MPAITIQSTKMTEAQKGIIAEKVTRIFSQVTNVPEDRIQVYFDSYPLESVARSGRLYSKNTPKYLEK
ncbi:MAG: tautomerase family protein [Candidatus Zixiibacteriota bacterium]